MSSPAARCSLIDMLEEQLSPDLIQKASSLVGETGTATHRGFEAAIPTVLAGLTKMSAQPEAGADVMRLISEFGRENHSATNIANMLSGGSLTDDLLHTGSSLLTGIFGGGSDRIASALALHAGIRPSSAGRLLSLAAFMALGALSSLAKAQNLNAAGIASLLSGQKSAVAGLLPAGMSSLVGFAEAGAGRTAGSDPREAVAPVRPPSIWKWLAALVLAALALFALWNWMRDSFARTELIPESNATVAALSAILRAYPNVGVKLEGHTDAVGTPEANKQLSLDRADTVRSMLVAAGVTAERIETEGFGADRPIASNETEEGRARNRRIELVVTKI